MEYSERLVRALVRSGGGQQLLARLLECQIDSATAHTLIESLEVSDACSIPQLAVWYHQIDDRELATIGLLRHFIHGAGSKADYCEQFVAAFGNHLTAPRDQALLSLARVRQHTNHGSPTNTIDAIKELQACLVQVDPGFLRSALLQWQHFYESAAYLRLGNLRKARATLASAIDELDPEDQRFGWLLRQRMASLHWHAGDYRRALQLHCDEADRECARAQEDWEHLIRSHLSAAKCAIDLHVSAKANQELIAAQELIEQAAPVGRLQRPYLILYSAELDTLWGNEREGIHLFEYAIELFSELDPPYYPGVLDAKVSLIQFAIREKEYDTVFTRIAELLLEAEERGCLDARARLLVYQASLLLDKGAGTRVLQEAYDDLIQRVHLINNPRLTFIAYANIYSYARESLSDYDQKFWLERMRGLEPLLEVSCFDGLYRDYVLGRYRHEIEGPLDRLESDLRELGEQLGD